LGNGTIGTCICGQRYLAVNNINHLLRNANGVRLAVLVNDFGELPIDADLIEGQDGDVINLSGGCVCCSYGDDLSLSLQKLQAQPELPDHIFIEASGVALPGAIGNSLSLLRSYQLEGIVVLADATTIQSSAGEKYIGDTVLRQLRDADLIILNKQDLMTDAQNQTVKNWIDGIQPNTPVVDAVHSTISPQALFEVEHVTEHNQDTGHHHNAASIFSTLSLSMEHSVDAKILAARLADKKLQLVRAKGFVRDTDNSLKTIQIVGRRWTVTPAPAGVKPGLVCIAQASALSESTIRSLCRSESQVVSN